MSGLILSCAIAAIVAAVVVSRFILQRYNAAVLASMHASRTSGIALIDEPAELSPRSRPIALQLTRIQPGSQAESTTLHRARQQRRRLTRALAIAGCLHAAVAAVLMSAAMAGETAPLFSVRRTVVLWLILSSAGLLPLIATGAVGRRQAVGWAAAGVVTVAVIAPSLLLTAAYLVGIPLLGAALLLTSPVRALAPFVFVGTFAIVFAVFFGIQIGLDVAAQIGSDFLPLILLVVTTAAVAVGVAGALVLLKWCAARFRGKRTSDLLLLLECWWLSYTLWICMVLALELGAAGLIGLLAFVTYQVVLSLQLGLPPAGSQTQPLPLLLLRVFGFRQRTESLLAGVGDSWRSVGTIMFIGAPDVATATLEPHETLEYLTGRLSRQFVTDSADLERRVSEADLAVDRDGRFRVTEFFCHDNTWRGTLQRLTREARVVLMDLRSFTSSNKGCEFELEQLLRLVPLHAVLLLTDETTDERLLGEVLKQKWQDAAQGSVNNGLSVAILKLMSWPSRKADYDVLTMALSGIADETGGFARRESMTGPA